MSLEYSVFIVAFASENLAKVFHSTIKMENQTQDMSGIRDNETKHAEVSGIFLSLLQRSCGYETNFTQIINGRERRPTH